MKALLLLRHADSGDKRQGQSDHERGLTSKGQEQLTAIASFMKKKDIRPDQIIASDALRVKLTVDGIASQLALTPVASYTNSLYEAGFESYIQAVRTAPECQTLLIAGHNPGIAAFASFVSFTKINAMGTGHLLIFHFKEDTWSKLDKGECELMEHFVP